MMRVDNGAAHALVERPGVDMRKLTAVHMTGSQYKCTLYTLIEASVGSQLVGVQGSPCMELFNERSRLFGVPLQDYSLAHALSACCKSIRRCRR